MMCLNFSKNYIVPFLLVNREKLTVEVERVKQSPVTDNRHWLSEDDPTYLYLMKMQTAGTRNRMLVMLKPSPRNRLVSIP